MSCRDVLTDAEAEALALEAERHALAVAMAESLSEDRARKAAEKPLEDWGVKDLMERYKASSILREVGDTSRHCWPSILDITGFY